VLELRGDRLRFTHPLLESGVEAALGPQEKSALHRRLAEIVTDPEERAGHLALGAEGPTEEVAAALHEAAGRAAARGAIGPAARFATEAVRLTPPDADVELAARRRLDAADYAFHNGNVAAGLGYVEPLLETLPPGPLHAAALLREARLIDASGTAAIVAVCRQAIAEADDDGLRAQAHGIAAEWVMHGGDVPGAIEEAAAAVEMARRANDDALLVEGLGRLSHYETYTASITPGLLEGAVELERGTVRPSNNYSPREIFGLRLMYADRLEEARELLEQSLATAVEIGDEPDRAALLNHLTQLECRAGRLARSLAYAREFTACAEQQDFEIPTLCFPTVLAAAHVGRVTEARAAAETAAAVPDSSELFRLLNLWALGFLELSLGQAEAAYACLRDLPGAFSRDGLPQSGSSAGIRGRDRGHHPGRRSRL
jgi:tetratricopeptide (TPR) repeat protein